MIECAKFGMETRKWLGVCPVNHAKGVRIAPNLLERLAKIEYMNVKTMNVKWLAHYFMAK
jgi:hypothetical protein